MQVVYLDQDKNWTRALYFIIIQESTVGHDQKLVVFCLIHLIYGSISCTYNVENSTRRVLKTAQRGVLQTQILCTYHYHRSCHKKVHKTKKKNNIYTYYIFYLFNFIVKVIMIMWKSLVIGFMAMRWMGRMGSVYGDSSSSSPEFVVPVMEEDAIMDEELRHILSTSGIVSIRMGDTDHLRQAALSHICHDDNGVSTILPDGTKRSTLATATYGMHRPFPLPTNQEVLEDLRRRVADLSVVFQQALDRIIHSTTTTTNNNNQSTLMTNAKTHQSYTSITQITSKATHLEHFHHYQAPTTTKQQEEAAVDVHVDAGLFLAFVPAMNCHDPQQPDRSLKLYLPEEHTAVLEPNTLVFMLGMGAR